MQLRGCGGCMPKPLKSLRALHDYLGSELTYYYTLYYYSTLLLYHYTTTPRYYHITKTLYHGTIQPYYTIRYCYTSAYV